MTGQGISMLLPTRGRTEELARLLASIVETARRPGRIEVVLYVDEDDPASAEFTFADLALVKHVGPPQSMGEMIGACYRLARRENVFLLNDDVVFRTGGWDDAVFAALEEFDDGVALVYGNDLHQGGRLPTFPILPRVVCDLLGGPAPADYFRSHIDAHLLDVFKCLRRLGHDRIRYLPEVVFEHLHPEAGKAAGRCGDGDARAADDETTWFAWAEQRRYAAWRLGRHIASADSGRPTGEP